MAHATPLASQAGQGAPDAITHTETDDVTHATSAAHLLSPRLHTTVDLAVPADLAIAQHESWAPAWVARPTWRSSAAWMTPLAALPADETVFLASYLEMAALLFAQARMPVFDQLGVRAIVRRDQAKRTLSLQLDVALIDFISQQVYRRVFEAAMQACHWMARHAPTAEHREQLYQTLETQVCAGLRNMVPAGKSTMPVLRVAHAMGIPFMHLGAGVYQLGWGSKAHRMDRSAIETDSAMGSRMAQNKVATAGLLRLAGLPAPVHEVVDRDDAAVEAAARLGYPVVLKPLDCDRGEGVTVDVRDADAVRRAFALAHPLSRARRVIVERQVDGVCHRLFIAHGRLLYAVKRMPMGVTGDGQRSVAELVDDALRAELNKPVWDRSPLQPLDERAVQALAGAGLAPDTVPARGVLAPLRRIESTEDGGVDEDVSAVIHPDNLAAALEAARLFGLQVAGIDIITADITRPWHVQPAIINEVNFAPLFGGGDISRSHIPRFLQDLMQGDGRIPVEACADKAAALARQAAHAAQGLRCAFTSARETVDASGRAIVMPFDELRRRVQALALRGDVDAIVVCA